MGNRRGRRPLSTARPGRRRNTHVPFIVGHDSLMVVRIEPSAAAARRVKISPCYNPLFQYVRCRSLSAPRKTAPSESAVVPGNT